MVSVFCTWLILRATTKIGRGQHALVKLYLRLAHWFGAFFAALEGHLFLQYIYPHGYFILFLIERHTGLDLSKFRYE